jgi:hypothetical protein
VIRAIFFDFDGVLTTDKIGSVTTTRYISQKIDVPVTIVKAAFAPYNRDLTNSAGTCSLRQKTTPAGGVIVGDAVAKDKRSNERTHS